MKEAIAKTRDALRLYNYRASELDALHIFHNLKYLHEKLEQVMETVMLAKVGVLNENILSQSEIGILINDLQKEGVAVQTASEVINHIIASVATNNREIALLLKLPKLDNRRLRKIYAHATLREGSLIHLTSNNYLVYHDQVFTAENLDVSIFEGHTVHWDNSSCAPNLIKGKPATCDYVENPVEEVIIIDKTHLLVNQNGNFTLSSNCGLTDRVLHGSYLIAYNNCKVTINNQSYSNKVTHMPGKQLHIDGIAIRKSKSVIRLSLHHLHDLHLETRKQLESIHLEAKGMTWPHWTIFGGLSSIVGFVLVVLLFSSFFRRQPQVNIQLDQHEETTTEATDLQDLHTMRSLRTESHS